MKGITLVTEEQLKKMQELKEGGFTYKQIAGRFNLSLTTTWVYLNKDKGK